MRWIPHANSLPIQLSLQNWQNSNQEDNLKACSSQPRRLKRQKKNLKFCAELLQAPADVVLALGASSCTPQLRPLLNRERQINKIRAQNQIASSAKSLATLKTHATSNKK
jgi:hypothetical protein